MGFGKYQEDIVSRYISDNNLYGRKNTSPPKPQDNQLTSTQLHKPNKDNKMSTLKQFASITPRPLPVIVLADTSGSMDEEGKIDVLNAALKDMLAAFAKESRLRAEIQFALITFGGDAEMQIPMTAVQNMQSINQLTANGGTPMGEALKITRELLEDKEIVPSRAYKPVIILLSDGMPTDDWSESFDEFCKSERAQKATRLAMAIGSDADEELLKKFANDKEAPLFHAHNARDIHRFFRAVTMSVTTRSASQNPNEATAFVVPPEDEDDLDLDF
jgi:uncharacterized protein YegL